MFSTDISRFRLITFLEGLSFVLLVFIAMPLKHIWDMPMAVRVIGMAHGALFVIFVFMLIHLTMKYKWSLGWSATLFITSLLPFAPFFVDQKLKKYENK